MQALETLTFVGTDPGHNSTGGVFVPASGDSLRVRASKKPRAVALWHHKNDSGFTRITSPRLHDGVVGLKVTGPSGYAWLWDGDMALEPQDTLTIRGSGADVGYDLVSMMVAYEGLPGVQGRFISPGHLRSRAIEWATVAVGGLPATSGDYTAAVTLEDIDPNMLKAGSSYAVVGIAVEGDGTGIGVLGIRAPDWGNLRIGMPAVPGTDYLPRFFPWLSDRVGESLIPVFNADNASSILIDMVADQDFVHLYADLILARIS